MLFTILCNQRLFEVQRLSVIRVHEYNAPTTTRFGGSFAFYYYFWREIAQGNDAHDGR
jgi:hypothetical protein